MNIIHAFGAGDPKAAEDRKKRQAKATARIEAAKKDRKTK
jgi:hypothetical protein